MHSSTGFHLPHNAVKPEEVQFIIEQLDINKDYYIYSDLRALVFEKEVQMNRFQNWHSSMYKRIHKSHKLSLIYDSIKRGQKSFSELSELQYTEKKTFKQVWNEITRDYFEFFAFTGLMPSYYKGKSRETEKRHYIGFTLKKYLKKEIGFEDILYKMKFRNASKNEENITEYNVRNRPFVVSLRVMDHFKQKGYKSIDAKVLMYIVRNTIDEDKLKIDVVDPNNTSSFNEQVLDELGRGVTFINQYMLNIFGIKKVKARNIVYSLVDFDLNKYKFFMKSIFIGDRYDILEITPSFIHMLFNPSSITDQLHKEILERHGLIENNISAVDFNVDTDLTERWLAVAAINQEFSYQIEKSRKYDFEVNESDELFRRGYNIALSSNGTEYEKFLFEVLKENLVQVM
jgi:hypothetical protein